ncbi:hypothetical protein Bind_3716 (plasmid) [Beijerinckia indica subsp. indica ATCC 9039]|uniref:Uncharacterized protein n=1 Tax=Beijerinckia indica subsp. indica (strain ATCC 9039 / DSM 1715 / NCIMB 8712) TaxID=395963 RepID=B2IL68_BEII9|nr:hypothetical protein Bind_3716 [Beijerinckia indica subsp. indica ATCC 9039]
MKISILSEPLIFVAVTCIAILVEILPFIAVFNSSPDNPFPVLLSLIPMISISSYKLIQHRNNNKIIARSELKPKCFT